MGEVKRYRSRVTVDAELVEEAGSIATSIGVMSANVGDYLVYKTGIGTVLVDGDNFREQFEEMSAEHSEGNSEEFSPVGKTVEEVVAYMSANPNDVTRVKMIEDDSPNPRKGIMGY